MQDTSFDETAFNFMDFSMLDGWELGPGGAQSAQEVSMFFDTLPNGDQTQTLL
jgi:hypothetical protein